MPPTWTRSQTLGSPGTAPHTAVLTVVRALVLTVLAAVALARPAAASTPNTDETPAAPGSFVTALHPDGRPTPWQRHTVWIPTGPWQPLPSATACQEGIHRSSEGERTAHEHHCHRRLQRPVAPHPTGPWQPERWPEQQQGQSGAAAHISIRSMAAATSWQSAPDDLALALTRQLRISRVEVRLSEHQLRVYGDDDQLLAVRPLSAGKPATATPAGTYRVQSRSRHSVALVDRRIHLDHMVRFNGSIGFHGIPYRVTPAGRAPLDTPLGEANVSLGCVRLDDRDAAWLYQQLADGATVTVTP
jgi:hypothetical protein